MSNRPFILDPLFRGLTALSGVGPKNSKLLEKLVGGPKVLDMLWHLPVDFIDRSFSPDVASAPNGRIVTIELTIDKHIPNARRSLPYRIQARDGSGMISLVFFHANRAWLEKQLPIGEKRVISGKVEYFGGNPQIVHPDAIEKPDNRDAIEAVEPIYPLTQGISNKVLRKAMHGALSAAAPLEEWQDAAYLKHQSWPSWHDAIVAVHNPDHERVLDPIYPARQRLAFDELLSHQLALAIVREKQRTVNGRAFVTKGALRARLMNALPFLLTGAQTRVLAEIDEDMGRAIKMLRLVQGDVGSGKTVVAALAMMNAAQSGSQAALMAPTEILARQHAETLGAILDQIGVRHVILTGRDKGKAREIILQQIRSGAAQIVIGTHAIFQDSVHYKDLGLAVIDEQHRFGVQQRLSLSSKNKGTDVLVMTATPIPRTLALTAYGDMDVSQIDEKPPGRKPIDTLLLPNDKLEDLVGSLRRKIAEGDRVYWVCPLVEESEFMDMAAAEERYDVLKSIFGDRVGLVHGRMKPADKDAVMERFVRGDLDILVATTVIEVGVNVPEATIMVIEHAERFGLSQLHQLRGRVGRGSEKSFCFLMYSGPLGETAKARLTTMRDTEDGFIIAEKDLELRGGGDILGIRQSGMPSFRLADLTVHGELLAAARDDARLILQKDPHLEGKRGEALRTLLYLFEQDQGIKTLRSG